MQVCLTAENVFLGLPLSGRETNDEPVQHPGSGEAQPLKGPGILASGQVNSLDSSSKNTDLGIFRPEARHRAHSHSPAPEMWGSKAASLPSPKLEDDPETACKTLSKLKILDDILLWV